MKVSIFNYYSSSEYKVATITLNNTEISLQQPGRRDNFQNPNFNADGSASNKITEVTVSVVLKKVDSYWYFFFHFF